MTDILLISGGNDSMYIYNVFVHMDFELVYFDYGQRYVKQEIKRLPRGTKIIKIPKLKVKDNGYVCGRNLMFLIELAKRYDEANIYMGSNSEDIFEDNNKAYLTKAIDVINTSFDTKLKVITPLARFSKKKIMNYINKSNIDTYSCYKGGKIPCGKCKACLSVINAT